MRGRTIAGSSRSSSCSIRPNTSFNARPIMIPSKYSLTRRLFLRRSIALGAAGIAPLMYQFEAIAAAAAQNPGNRVQAKAISGANDLATTNPDYKALVCLFMYGGNDNANFII